MRTQPAEATLTLAPPSMTVREARDAYLAENGFSLDEYERRLGWLIVLGLKVPIPNLAGRRRALPLHDLHHVALGFGTDVVGELEVSAWEQRGGVRGFGWFVRGLVLQATIAGLLTAPRRTLAAWRQARGQRSLYVAPLRYEELLSMTVGELRAHLGVPAHGIAKTTPKPHAAAPVRAHLRAA